MSAGTQLPDSWSTRGCVAEYTFITLCMKQGWLVFKSLHPQSPYDMVVDFGSGPKRVEVKSVSKSKDKGLVCVPTHSNEPYPPDSFDYLAAVHPESGQVWVIPGEVACGRRSISVSSERYGDYRV